MENKSLIEVKRICAVCRRAEATLFILPDLRESHPSFRGICCEAEACRLELASSFNVGDGQLLPIRAETLDSFPDDDKAVILRFFKELHVTPFGP